MTKKNQARLQVYRRSRWFFFIDLSSARVTNAWVVAPGDSRHLPANIDNRFQLPALIQDTKGVPPFLAFFSPEGYWGGHSIPEESTPPETTAHLLRNLPDQAKTGHELHSRWKARPPSLRYVSTVVPPFGGLCRSFKPCVAFEEGGQMFVYLPPASVPPHGVLIRTGARLSCLHPEIRRTSTGRRR